MALVEIRDHAVWIAHIHGDSQLTDRLNSMAAGEVVKLDVDGYEGDWRKMDDGRDGRPTAGLRPIGKTKDVWLDQQARRGDVVTIRLVTPKCDQRDQASPDIRDSLVLRNQS